MNLFVSVPRTLALSEVCICVHKPEDTTLLIREAEIPHGPPSELVTTLESMVEVLGCCVLSEIARAGFYHDIVKSGDSKPKFPLLESLQDWGMGFASPKTPGEDRSFPVFIGEGMAKKKDHFFSPVFLTPAAWRNLHHVMNLGIAEKLFSPVAQAARQCFDSSKLMLT